MVEVSFSQPIEEVSTKAIDYLTLSNRNIELVIGPDTSYDERIDSLTLQGWTLTVYTKNGTACWGKSIEKEICKGDHVNTGTLIILLKSFGPPDALILTYPHAYWQQQNGFTYSVLP